MVGAREQDSRYELLVLDFGGVCTPSHAEFLTADQHESALAPVRPECARVVAEARARGITVAVLSNEIDRAWADTTPLLNDVDHVIACSDNGILKPDRRAFQRALLVGECGAEVSLVVDDEEDNVRSAASLGIDTILFDTGDPAGSWRSIAEALGLETG